MNVFAADCRQVLPTFGIVKPSSEFNKAVKFGKTASGSATEAVKITAASDEASWAVDIGSE